MNKSLALTRLLLCFGALSLSALIISCVDMGPSPEIQNLRVKAMAGDARAQLLLGSAYDTGHGVKADIHEAAKWYEAAARQGDSEAQNDIGSLYLFGEGVPQDGPTACEWFSKSAAQNNNHGKGNLAVCYDQGIGMPKDLARAAVLYIESAEAGNIQSMLNIGVDYWRGYGLPADPVKGYMWLDLARFYTQTGNVNRQLKWRIRGALDQLSREMPPKDVAKGEALARSWDKANRAKVQAAPKY